MKTTTDYKMTLGAVGLGAAGLICLQKVKQLVIENYLLKQHLHQQQQMMIAGEEAIKQHLAEKVAGNLALPQEGETFGFSRALAEEVMADN